MDIILPYFFLCFFIIFTWVLLTCHEPHNIRQWQWRWQWRWQEAMGIHIARHIYRAFGRTYYFITNTPAGTLFLLVKQNFHLSGQLLPIYTYTYEERKKHQQKCIFIIHNSDRQLSYLVTMLRTRTEEKKPKTQMEKKKVKFKRKEKNTLLHENDF